MKRKKFLCLRAEKPWPNPLPFECAVANIIFPSTQKKLHNFLKWLHTHPHYMSAELCSRAENVRILLHILIIKYLRTSHRPYIWQKYLIKNGKFAYRRDLTVCVFKNIDFSLCGLWAGACSLSAKSRRLGQPTLSWTFRRVLISEREDVRERKAKLRLRHFNLDFYYTIWESALFFFTDRVQTNLLYNHICIYENYA